MGKAGGPGDEWATPQRLFNRMNSLCCWLTGDEFGIDVCASAENTKVSKCYLTKEQDALSKSPLEWAQHGPCWMNPPYSDPYPWLKHAEVCATNYGGVVFALLPAAIETRYFKEFVVRAETALALSKRVRFVGATASAKGPNVVVIFRRHWGPTHWEIPFDVDAPTVRLVR